MGIYVYAVYQPTEPPFFLGAWEKYEEARQAVLGDCSDGTEPSDKKYRVVQLYYSRGTSVTNGSRAYTVQELDALRYVMEAKWRYGSYVVPLGNCMSRSYSEGEKVKAVEEMVRTAMIAGHTAEDYIASVQRA